MRVIEFPDRLSLMERENIHIMLKKRGLDDVLILEGGAKYTQFGETTIPDAICLHCGRANLGTSYQCLGCNAPLVHTERKP